MSASLPDWMLVMDRDIEIEPKPRFRGGATSRGIYDATTASGRYLLFKWYTPKTLAEIDLKALAALIEWRHRLSSVDRATLDNVCAFPLGSVWHGGTFSGVVMEAAPDNFFRTDRQNRRIPATADLLSLSETRAELLGVNYLPPPHKLATVGKLVRTLSFLHRNDVVVGDLQPQNLLISTRPGWVDNFLIDCDSMWVNGRHALPPHDPPHWRMPGASAFSKQSDLHKALLLAARALREDTSFFDPEESAFTAHDMAYFRRYMPSDHVRIFERVLGGRGSAENTSILSVARNWQGMVRSDGTMYVATDDSPLQLWDPPAVPDPPAAQAGVQSAARRGVNETGTRAADDSTRTPPIVPIPGRRPFPPVPPAPQVTPTTSVTPTPAGPRWPHYLKVATVVIVLVGVVALIVLQIVGVI